MDCLLSQRNTLATRAPWICTIAILIGYWSPWAQIEQMAIMTVDPVVHAHDVAPV